MDVIMPQLGETVTEGVVTRWYKAVGDSVKAEEMLFDVETDKVSTEIPAPASGVITEIVVGEGATAKVGARLAVIRETGAAAGAALEAAASPAATRPQSSPTVSTGGERMRPAGDRLSPVVRRLFTEHRLRPGEINGTGRDGRITRDDVLGYLASRGGASTGEVRTQPPVAYNLSGVTRKRLSAIRRRTAQRMVHAWTTAPHVLQAVEVDFHKVERVREAAGAAWKTREGFALTYLPFIASAVASALAQYPLLNASLDGDDLVLHSRINLGIAVDLALDGLVVPVIAHVPNKSLPQLARAISDVAQRARQNRLKPDEITGGTYTLSNSGVFGTLITAPIINQPQVAILSSDGIAKKPVVIEGPDGDSIAIRPVGVLAQSFDHRAVDGAYSAAFLREVKMIIETRDWEQALNRED